MKLTILCRLKMGLVLATEGGLHQTKTHYPCLWCVKGNGAGVGVSDDEKRMNNGEVGWGSNNLPNRSAI
jgi:hypothetical protein